MLLSVIEQVFISQHLNDVQALIKSDICLDIIECKNITWHLPSIDDSIVTKGALDLEVAILENVLFESLVVASTRLDEFGLNVTEVLS